MCIKQISFDFLTDMFGILKKEYTWLWLVKKNEMQIVGQA